jgi:acetyltransferase-like isoleucine patch superfamily enzyme/acyl carrier protein
LRWAYRKKQTFSLPTPNIVVRPLLAAFLILRGLYYFLVRVFVCEPLFKAYCTKVGRGVRTGECIHWISGSGRLIIGDNVLLDGKSSFMFAVRYATMPTLSIGSQTTISGGCSLTVGREISIGNNCLIASGVYIFDSPGHPTDPVLRKNGHPARPEDVRPVKIESNVWLGTNSVVFPGVTIGEGSVVAIGSHVVSDVPAYTMVAGNPARVVAHLTKESSVVHQIDDSCPAKRNNVSESPDTLKDVIEVICQVMGTNGLTPDEDFCDAGLTSIMLLPLLIALEDRFNVIIPQEDFLNLRTARVLSSQIAKIVSDRKSLEASLDRRCSQPSQY